MSQEKVLETLESLGFAKSDAQVYIFLGKRSPQKAKDIAKALKIPKQTLYLVIKNLQSKGIITATLERPSRFSAVPFGRLLDLFVKAKTEEIHHIKKNKKELLSSWQAISVAEVADQSPKFTVIEGRSNIYPKLKQMIEETRNQISLISTIPSLVRADQFGLLDAAFSHASKTKTKFRFVTELSRENLKALKLLLGRIPKRSNFEGRAPELGLKPISRMLIRDDAEAAFFVSQETDRTDRGTDEVCLWTNSTAIVNSFKTVFEDLWQNSTAIERAIAAIETGKPKVKTCVITDPEAAKKKYDAAIGAAKTEITIMTSAPGLIEVSKNIIQLKEKAEGRVPVRIMAAITRDNLEVAMQLSGFCKVRHVPASYLGTTIVDQKHLFQFKNASSSSDKNSEDSAFESTFYTNDSEYVERSNNMLNDIWKNAVTPSAITLDEITKPTSVTSVPVPDDEYIASRKDSPYQKMLIKIDEKPGAITEEYVLNKIINARRTIVKDPMRDTVRLYGSQATAVVHVGNLKLPDMILSFFHCNKQSSFGAEDWFQVHMWLETPNGFAFVPVAIVGDNPKGMEGRRLSFAGTPASQNCHLLKKDELQVHVHGNTVFAGWTVPIQLFPAQYILPPAALLFEGYGKPKPSLLEVTTPSGAKTILETNGFETFVTFFHPESKYAGPGTDGTIARDMIMTVYPPSAKLAQNPRDSFRKAPS